MGSLVKIRLGTPADIPDLVAIDREDRDTPWSTATFQKELANPLGRLTIAVHDQKIIGYLITWLIGDELQIHHLAVRRAFRSQGVGGRLLSDGLDHARAEGATVAILEVRVNNRPARQLYEKHGFVEVGRRPGYYRKPAEDALLMNADLGGIEQNHKL